MLGRLVIVGIAAARTPDLSNAHRSAPVLTFDHYGTPFPHDTEKTVQAAGGGFALLDHLVDASGVARPIGATVDGGSPAPRNCS